MEVMKLKTYLKGVDSKLMKNQTIIKIIIVIVVITACIAAAIIITEVVLGYSGFRKASGKDTVISVADGCQQQYTNNRFKDAIGINLQVCFIFALISLLFSLLTVLYTCCFLVCLKPQGEEREETRIEGLQSHHGQQNQSIERYHPKVGEIVFLYFLVVVGIVASYVPFNFYLQTIIHAHKSSCQIYYQYAEVLALDILSLTMLVLSLIAFILLLALVCRYHDRMKMLEVENGSESYRQQVDRIIREIPESERRFYEYQDRRKALSNQQNKHQQILIREHSDSHKSQVKIQHVQQVQSVLYKVEPSLMLQSVNVNHQ